MHDSRSRQRLGWLDAAKGIGIFLVVAGHALPLDGLAAKIIWAFHMPLFFFLSGVTAKAWRPGAGPAAARGLKRLVIPYLSFSTIAIVLWLCSTGKIGSDSAWATALAQMAYGVAGPQERMPYDVPLWFFTCLVSVRVLFYAITALFASAALRLAAAAAAALIACLVIFPRFYSFAWNLDVAPVALVFFMAGYVVQDAAHGLRAAARAPIVAGALIAFALCIAFNERVDMNGRILGNPLLFCLGAFAGILLTVEVAQRCASIRVLTTLGHASIVIFPVHLLFALLPYRAVPSMTWYAFRITHSELLAAVLTAIVEIALCLPMYAAILRWAPFLIGQEKQSPGVAMNTRGGMKTGSRGDGRFTG